MTNIPGLKLDEDGFAYEGEILLSSWAGFQSRNGPYSGIDSQTPSNGKCQIFVDADYKQDDESAKPYYINAYNYLLENQERIKQQILDSLLSHYANWQTLYGYGPEEKEEYMPDVDHVDNFKKLIGLSIVHLIDVEKDGFGYVGFEFGCTWDEEHGIGVMTHKDRIIRTAAADTAFSTWVAEEDKRKNRA